MHLVQILVLVFSATLSLAGGVIYASVLLLAGSIWLALAAALLGIACAFVFFALVDIKSRQF